MPNKEVATVMFSREELLTIQWCVIYALDQDQEMNPDMRKDAVVLLEELRYILGETPEDVGLRVAQQIARRLRDAYAATD